MAGDAMSWVSKFDSAAAIKLVMELMAIPGRSKQEGNIVELIVSKLLAAGVSPSNITTDNANRRIPGGGEVGNLIVKLPGTQRGPRRLLMAHLDTVPICVGCQPVLDRDIIRSANASTGLGGDDRAGVAVVLTAILELLRLNLPHPPLTLFFAVQEEIGLYGARFVQASKLGSPKFCFNWDGGDPRFVSVGATGDYAIEIEIEGLASHAGVHPERGINAITIASLAIADLTENGWHGLIEKGKHRGTSNVGIVHAGEATNVVTPSLTLRAEARSHDPVFRKKIVDAYQKAFAKAAKSVKSADGKTGKVTFRSDLKYESFRLDPQEPVVSLAESAVAHIGLTPELCVGNGGLDANWMTAHGFPTVTLGCGQRDIHTVNEWLHVPSFLQGCQIAMLLASGDLG
ncbi:M20/M25/M40 family metallo-hydrolase [Schlesneria paludicola]|uniref:M20/M25/M40 family metallo-hydrolase n=1 Tax=Schlesneria paludicola TaxID=360056 RepID=UPI00029AAA96|nr:M20/M25/M40 family metallo-hydrolase [Schlesneria paludicola]